MDLNRIKTRLRGVLILELKLKFMSSYDFDAKHGLKGSGSFCCHGSPPLKRVGDTGFSSFHFIQTTILAIKLREFDYIE